MMRFTLGLIALVCGFAPLFAQARPTPPAAPTAPRFGIRVEMDGIYVQGVEKDSAASTAGLKPGDVIVRCDDTEISDFDAMRGWIVAADTTKPHQMTVSRHGKGEAWSEERAVAFQFGADKTLGIVIAEGLRVTRVSEGSIAAAAGLRPGDFLTRFGALEGPNGEQLAQAIQTQGTRRGNGGVPLAWIRDNRDRDGIASFGGRRPSARPLPRVPGRPAPSAPRPALPMSPANPLAQLLDRAPVAEMEGIVSASAELEKAIAILKQRANEDEELARALAHVEASRAKLAPLADRLKSVERAMQQAGNSIRGAMRFIDDFDGDFGDLDMEDLMDRFGELMEEGIDGEKLQRLMESEFGEIIEGMEIEEDGGRIRIQVQPKNPKAPSSPLRPQKAQDKKPVRIGGGGR